MPKSQPFHLPSLPYENNALSPYISSTTITYHYGKHHAGYVSKLNELVQDTPLAEKSLEQVIQATYGKAEQTAICNNAAQAWNHSFYWKSLMPKGGGQPSQTLRERIESSLGRYEKLKEELVTSATTLFGSGWAWLVADQGKCKVWTSKNADTPMVHGLTPLLTIDVWEHAYYLDYQNRRKDYVEAFLDHLVNWNFAIENLT